MQVNDKVTWTQISRRGKTVSMKLMAGKIVTLRADNATVALLTTGRKYEVGLSALRLASEKSTLKEFCDELFAANREADHA